MTLGDYRVGVDFNPSGDKRVDFVKQNIANLIDLCQDLAIERKDEKEVVRLFSIAVEHLEDAAMWAVKAITKKPNWNLPNDDVC